jgi:hypothetical protein
VVKDQERALCVRHQPAALSGGHAYQSDARVAEFERRIEVQENEERKVRRQKLELEEQLRGREKEWKAEKDRLTSDATVSQKQRDARIETLMARCSQLEARNTELRACSPSEMAATLRLAQDRVRTLEKQVGELVAMGGVRTGVYDLLYDMAECMSKMGKDMKEVRFDWL